MSEAQADAVVDETPDDKPAPISPIQRARAAAKRDLGREPPKPRAKKAADAEPSARSEPKAGGMVRGLLWLAGGVVIGVAGLAAIAYAMKKE